MRLASPSLPIIDKFHLHMKFQHLFLSSLLQRTHKIWLFNQILSLMIQIMSSSCGSLLAYNIFSCCTYCSSLIYVSSVMEKSTASVFRVDDTGSRFLWDISQCLGHHHYTKSHKQFLGIYQWTTWTVTHNITRHHCCSNKIWKFFQGYVVLQLTHKQDFRNIQLKICSINSLIYNNT